MQRKLIHRRRNSRFTVFALVTRNITHVHPSVLLRTVDPQVLRNHVGITIGGIIVAIFTSSKATYARIILSGIFCLIKQDIISNFQGVSLIKEISLEISIGCIMSKSRTARSKARTFLSIGCEVRLTSRSRITDWHIVLISVSVTSPKILTLLCRVGLLPQFCIRRRQCDVFQLVTGKHRIKLCHICIIKTLTHTILALDTGSSICHSNTVSTPNIVSSIEVTQSLQLVKSCLPILSIIRRCSRRAVSYCIDYINAAHAVAIAAHCKCLCCEDFKSKLLASVCQLTTFTKHIC